MSKTAQRQKCVKSLLTRQIPLLLLGQILHDWKIVKILALSNWTSEDKLDSSYLCHFHTHFTLTFFLWNFTFTFCDKWKSYLYQTKSVRTSSFGSSFSLSVSHTEDASEKKSLWPLSSPIQCRGNWIFAQLRLFVQDPLHCNALREVTKFCRAMSFLFIYI